jgi:two-component system NtrC family response regulator
MTENGLLEPVDLGFSTETEGWGGGRPAEIKTLREARDFAERQLIAVCIERNGGNIAKAAEELGVSRPTLYDLMRKHAVQTGH